MSFLKSIAKKKLDYYYLIDRLLSVNALYNMLLSKRSKGKSFQVKKYVLDRYFLNHEHFVLMRRMDTDLKTNQLSRYLVDKPLLEYIEKKTNGNFNSVYYYAGNFYLCFEDFETGKRTKGPMIGTCVSINRDEHFKSCVYDDCSTIIFEEFISQSGLYLNNECQRFEHLVSTIFRNDFTGKKIFMIGNTLSKINPYVDYWNLQESCNISETPGRLDLHEKIASDGSSILIAIEDCSASVSDNGFFGQASKNISNNHYSTREYSKFFEPFKKENSLFEIIYKINKFSFKICLYSSSDGMCLYIFPSNSETLFTISPVPSANVFNIPKLNRNNRAMLNMINLWNLNRVFYSTDTCGTDFNDCLTAYGNIF